jgi:hypothetical protein
MGLNCSGAAKEFPQSSADLREPLAVHHLSGFGSQPEVRSAITIQGAKKATLFDHFAQGHHHRGGGFLLDQLRVIDFTAGVVQNHDQIVLLPAQPTMPAGVGVQQQPGHWPALSLTAMRTTLARFGH